MQCDSPQLRWREARYGSQWNSIKTRIDGCNSWPTVSWPRSTSAIFLPSTKVWRRQEAGTRQPSKPIPYSRRRRRCCLPLPRTYWPTVGLASTCGYCATSPTRGGTSGIDAISRPSFRFYSFNKARNRLVCTRLTGTSVCFLSSMRNWKLDLNHGITSLIRLMLTR